MGNSYALLIPSLGFAQSNPVEVRPTPAQEKDLLRPYQRLLDADAKRDTAAFKTDPGAELRLCHREATPSLRASSAAAAETSTNRPSYTLHGCRIQMHGTTADRRRLLYPTLLHRESRQFGRSRG